MAYKTDFAPGQNKHVNYEPSVLGGLQEHPKPAKDYAPRYEGNLTKQHIDRTNTFKQAGETYRNFEDWERDELISNLSADLAGCDKRIQDKMVEHFTQADKDYGKRVAEGIKMKTEMMMKMKQEQGTDGPEGNTSGEEAVKQAQEKSHPAKPY